MDELPRNNAAKVGEKFSHDVPLLRASVGVAEGDIKKMIEGLIGDAFTKTRFGLSDKMMRRIEQPPPERPEREQELVPAR